jgi:hypothetical protein
VTLTSTHQELLTRSRKVQSAALDLDAARLRREVQAMLAAFVDHAGQVEAALADLPPATMEDVSHGQRRVLKRLLALSVAAEAPEVAPRCYELGYELTALVALLAETERRACSRAGASPALLALAR